jgi:peptidoglycan/LPS O-acetylase OafA/YrhL
VQRDDREDRHGTQAVETWHPARCHVTTPRLLARLRGLCDPTAMSASAPVVGSTPEAASEDGWRPTYLPQLDGLRAVAVGLVVLYHASALAHGPRVKGAFLGVDVFFVLSGFLITSLLLAEHRKTGGVRLLSFYARRFWRLYPALAVVTAAMFAWCALVPDTWLPDAATGHATVPGAWWALTYLSSWAVSANHSIGYLGPTWSLSVEEHFYLIWPLVLLYLLRHPAASLARRVTVLVAASAAYPVLLTLLGTPPSRLYAAPDTRAVQLFVGCLLGVVLSSPDGVRRVLPLTGSLGTWTAIGLLALGVAGTRRQYVLYLTVGQVVVALAAAVLIAHLVLRSSWLTRLLSRPLMVRVGKWSYSIYLWHVIAMAVPYYWLGRTYAAHALGAALAVVLAASTYRWVEQPVLRRFGRRAPASV